MSYHDRIYNLLTEQEEEPRSKYFGTIHTGDTGWEEDRVKTQKRMTKDILNSGEAGHSITVRSEGSKWVGKGENKQLVHADPDSDSAFHHAWQQELAKNNPHLDIQFDTWEHPDNDTTNPDSRIMQTLKGHHKGNEAATNASVAAMLHSQGSPIDQLQHHLTSGAKEVLGRDFGPPQEDGSYSTIQKGHMFEASFRDKALESNPEAASTKYDQTATIFNQGRQDSLIDHFGNDAQAGRITFAHGGEGHEKAVNQRLQQVENKSMTVYARLYSLLTERLI